MLPVPKPARHAGKAREKHGRRENCQPSLLLPDWANEKVSESSLISWLHTYLLYLLLSFARDGDGRPQLHGTGVQEVVEGLWP